MTNPTVNNFRPPERTLEGRDETDLTLALSQHPGTIGFGALGTDPSSEPQQFARKLQQTFQAAGWRVTGVVAMYSQQLWYGVEVDAKGKLTDPVPDNAAQVVRALHAAHVKGIRITPQPNWRDDNMSIVVGANPDK